MSPIKSIACAWFIATLAACSASDGYYDSHGNFVPSDPYKREKVNKVATQEYASYPGVVRARPSRTKVVTYVFDAPGYYDPYGSYVTYEQSGFEVPQNMFPPHGLCRVWLPKRNAYDQPPIESCEGIGARVPVGAYVIYGGQ
jgi:hypothetical protein